MDARLLVAVENLDEIRRVAAAAEEPVHRLRAGRGYDILDKRDHGLRYPQPGDEHRNARRIRDQELRGDAPFAFAYRHELTVAAGRAGSHQGHGWETFTDAVVRELASRRAHLVFLLWGSYAQKKGAFIDRTRHLVLTSAHPSPLSAHRGFFGCGHFRKANDYLAQNGLPPIAW